MISQSLNTATSVLLVRNRIKAYFELLKPRLSFLVAFSSAFGYLLGMQGFFSFWPFAMLCLGGFLISGASVTINQIIERDLDALMKRTYQRPLPSKRITVKEALWVAMVTAALGIVLLLEYTNPLTVVLSLASLVLYSFVYTPLKRRGPIAVFVGAIPGALPPLLGWIAATGVISYEALVLFGIQFIWQFPHFWAIAWVSHEA